jgi:hypothetical protein
VGWFIVDAGIRGLLSFPFSLSKTCTHMHMHTHWHAQRLLTVVGRADLGIGGQQAAPASLLEAPQPPKQESPALPRLLAHSNAAVELDEAGCAGLFRTHTPRVVGL